MAGVAQPSFCWRTQSSEVGGFYTFLKTEVAKLNAEEGKLKTHAMKRCDLLLKETVSFNPYIQRLYFEHQRRKRHKPSKYPQAYRYSVIPSLRYPSVWDSSVKPREKPASWDGSKQGSSVPSETGDDYPEKSSAEILDRTPNHERGRNRPAEERRAQEPSRNPERADRNRTPELISYRSPEEANPERPLEGSPDRNSNFEGSSPHKRLHIYESSDSRVPEASKENSLTGFLAGDFKRSAPTLDVGSSADSRACQPVQVDADEERPTLAHQAAERTSNLTGDHRMPVECRNNVDRSARGLPIRSYSESTRAAAAVSHSQSPVTCARQETAPENAAASAAVQDQRALHVPGTSKPDYDAFLRGVPYSLDTAGLHRTADDAKLKTSSFYPYKVSGRCYRMPYFPYRLPEAKPAENNVYIISDGNQYSRKMGGRRTSEHVQVGNLQGTEVRTPEPERSRMKQPENAPRRRKRKPRFARHRCDVSELVPEPRSIKMKAIQNKVPETRKYTFYKYYGFAGQGAKTSWAHNRPLGLYPPYAKPGPPAPAPDGTSEELSQA